MRRFRPTRRPLMPERTLPHLFEESVAAFPGNVLIWEKTGPTLRADDVRRTCGPSSAASPPVFWASGSAQGDRAALISEGRRDWIVAELGILYARARSTCPYRSRWTSSDDLKFRLAHSGCRMAVVSEVPTGEGPPGQERPARSGPDGRPGRYRVPGQRRDRGGRGPPAEATNSSRPGPRSSRPPGLPSGRAIPPTSAIPRARRPTPRASS